MLSNGTNCDVCLTPVFFGRLKTRIVLLLHELYHVIYDVNFNNSNCKYFALLSKVTLLIIININLLYYYMIYTIVYTFYSMSHDYCEHHYFIFRIFQILLYL